MLSSETYHTDQPSVMGNARKARATAGCSEMAKGGQKSTNKTYFGTSSATGRGAGTAQDSSCKGKGSSPTTSGQYKLQVKGRGKGEQSLKSRAAGGRGAHGTKGSSPNKGESGPTTSGHDNKQVTGRTTPVKKVAHVGNLAYEAAWSMYPQLRKFDEGTSYWTDEAWGAAYKAAEKNGFNAGRSCVGLYMAATAEDRKELDSALNLHGQQTVNQMYSTLVKSGHHHIVYHLQEEVLHDVVFLKLEELARVGRLGSAKPRCALLVAEGETTEGHLLPLSRPSLSARIHKSVHQIERSDEDSQVGAKPADREGERTFRVVKSCQRGQDEAPKRPTTVVVSVRSRKQFVSREFRKKHDEFYALMKERGEVVRRERREARAQLKSRVPWEYCKTTLPEFVRRTAEHSDHVGYSYPVTTIPTHWFHSAELPEGWADARLSQWEGKVAESAPEARQKRGVYLGMFPCPDDHDWAGEWWPLSGCGAPSLRQAVREWLRTPTTVSATPDYANRFGTRVHYRPPVMEGVWRACAERQVTDGHKVTAFFTAGDAVVCNNITYVAEQVQGSELLRLKPVEASCGCVIRNSLPTWLGRLAKRSTDGAGLTVIPKTECGVTAREQAMVKWCVRTQTMRNPLEIAAMTRLRQVAAAKDYKDCTDADRAAAFVNAVTASHPQLESVAGPFAWGYCYSCGKQLPGRFKQRLCEGCQKRKNTGLGELVSRGEHVCSTTQPVVYPGVVNTPTRHPPLKEGVKTRADESVFR